MSLDVLVVGAGPVGLTMAAELARYGVKVRVVEKAAARTDKSKALVLWSRTLELLEAAGCAGAFVQAGVKAKAANFVAGGRRLGRVELGVIRSAYDYALMLPQSETERLLEAHLTGLGVQVERQVELVSFTDDGGAVLAVLGDAEGREERVPAAWLVGCDGAHSTVRHALGMPFLGETLNTDWLLADVHLRDMPFAADELAMFLHPDGVLATFPIGPGRYRIIADTGPAKGERPVEPSLAQVQAVVDRRGPGGITLSDPVWLSAFRINERKVRDYRQGRVFLAGDAAHVHSPAGGQGMNTGMQDAINLAWKLALVCHGSGGERLLDSYSVERSGVGAMVLADAGRMTAVALLKGEAAQRLRNFGAGILLGLPPFRSLMANKLAELSIEYLGSPMNGTSYRGHGPATGQRVPPVAGAVPVGAGSRPRFALFGTEAGAASKALQPVRHLLEPEFRPPLSRRGGVHLVRPDGYVAMVARQGDYESVAGCLDSLRG